MICKLNDSVIKQTGELYFKKRDRLLYINRLISSSINMILLVWGGQTSAFDGDKIDVTSDSVVF
jgi:hypothetical protein